MGFVKWVLRIVWWVLVLAVSALLTDDALTTIIIWSTIVLFFYFNRFLFRQVLRRGYFFGYFVLAMLQVIGLSMLAEKFLFKTIDIPNTDGTNYEVPSTFLLIVLLIVVLAVNLQVTILKDWFKSVVIENRLAKTEHQLARVKLNPHFFKNVLNDLYSLVYLKKDEAAQAVVELKELMEYVIYDSDVNYISLDRELNAAKQIVNIQKHRLPAYVPVTFQLFIEQQNILIPPMIFFPFLENVFRHADLTSNDAMVDIKLRVKNNALMYRVKSKMVNSKALSNSPGGIGITTLEGRLYESYGLIGYSIDNKQKNGYYYAKLEIFNLQNAANEN